MAALIGTSGFSYPEWIGPFYPPGTKQSDFLKLYAREFRMTELNYTYYRQPQAATTRRMAEVTGEGFLFAVKAHKTLTHETGGDLKNEAAAFISGIEPLAEAGKLGVVLLQFPYSFHYTDNSRRYLDSLTTSLSILPLAVQFRNAEWQREQVYGGLKDRSVALVNVDEPDLAGLLKPGEIVTSATGYVRFHGRNKANWWTGDNVTRYDYLYSDDELKEWIPRIMRMMQKAKVLMIVFNNHSKGQAVRNARRLREMMGEDGGGVTS
jgi:uncharacterized protein YecE (DUF72 family)